jgi:sulfur-carrier protein
MATVTIRYWAAAREAAGRAEEEIEAITLGDALETVGASRGAALRRVLAASSFLVDGTPAGRHTPDLILPEAAVVEILPQFAGG